MRPPYDPDSEFVCTGSTVVFSRERGGRFVTAETPREVREVIRDANDQDTILIELHHNGDREVPMYVDWRQIIAILPYWTKVEA